MSADAPNIFPIPYSVATVWLATMAGVLPWSNYRPEVAQEQAKIILDMLKTGSRVPVDPCDVENAHSWLDSEEGKSPHWVQIVRGLIPPRPKPTTKEVDVWHFEMFDTDEGPRITILRSRGEAEDALRAATNANIICKRVTGPHKQLVPAD